MLFSIIAYVGIDANLKGYFELLFYASGGKFNCKFRGLF
jgi:hypothetical protein